MSKSNQTPKGRDVYAMVTNRIIVLLEQGVIPWRKSWTDAGIPRNLVTMKPYRGANVWLLSTLNYNHNLFLTYKQAKDLGGSIKKGEKGYMVIFTKWIDEENSESNEKSKKGVLKYYLVFNIAQCDGIPQEKIPVIARTNNPIKACESIVASMPQCPPIYFQNGGPYYNQKEDYINMPLLNEFESGEEFYITLFHEMIHSTGHQSRLDRKEVTSKVEKSSEAYSTEELIAEFGACYLMSHAGLQEENLGNSAAYIQSWLNRLNDDKRIVVFIAAKAQRAVEFILNVVAPQPSKQEMEVQHE